MALLSELEEVGQLRSELDKLHQLLHESQERESMAVEEVETVRTEVDSLREEVKRLEGEVLESSAVEQEYVRAKLELEVEKAVLPEKRSWQETEDKLLKELVEVREQLSNSDGVMALPGRSLRTFLSPLYQSIYPAELITQMSIPPLGKFSGAVNESEDEQFTDWIE